MDKEWDKYNYNINAKHLITTMEKHLRQKRGTPEIGDGEYSNGWIRGYTVALNIICGEPKAEDRTHGEWIGEEVWEDSEENSHCYMECSVCHHVRIIDDFCGHCGADMRGEKE